MSGDAKQVQLRRGTYAEHQSFTGAAGEVTVVTDKDDLRIHNGSTPGGVGVRTVSIYERKDNDNFDVIVGNYTDGYFSGVSQVMFSKLLGDYAFRNNDWEYSAFTRADWKNAIWVVFTSFLSSSSDSKLDTLTEGVS